MKISIIVPWKLNIDGWSSRVILLQKKARVISMEARKSIDYDNLIHWARILSNVPASEWDNHLESKWILEVKADNREAFCAACEDDESGVLKGF